MGELLVVALGELSGTHFGKSVDRADLRYEDGSLKLTLESGLVKLDFNCEKQEAVGTYVVFDENTSIVGTSTEVVRILE